MNWRLIFLLSLLGLAMAIATIYVLPSRAGSVLWFAIFAFDAFAIARQTPSRRFTHGFLVGLANWVWVAGAKVVLFDAYVARHAQEAAATRAMLAPIATASAFPIVGPALHAAQRYDLPIPGVSGVIIGALAWLASKAIAPRPGAR